MDNLNPWFAVGLLVFGVYVVLAMIGSRDRSRREEIEKSAASQRPHGALPRARKPES
jgi:hypothetical protein